MKRQLKLPFSPAPGPAIRGSPLPPDVIDLLDAARQNETAWRRFQALSLDLMASDGLEELLELLLWQVPAAMQWDTVSLHVVDTDHEVRRLLADVTDSPSKYRHLRTLDNELELEFDYRGRGPLPRLGAYLANRHERLFQNSDQTPASVAMLPLRRGLRWLGSYHIGSYSADRFHRSLATDFLQHLSAVISICLETAINREQLRRLGLTDALTTVGNRRYFDHRLQEEIARAQRSQSPLSCLFIDIDYFKAVNDRHGHAAGDAVLQAIAYRIRQELRGADVIARYGGEEFAVLLPQADAARAAEVAERIRICVAGTPIGTGAIAVSVSISVSVGVATLRQDSINAQAAGLELLRNADAALYRAKASGRNQVSTI